MFELIWLLFTLIIFIVFIINIFSYKNINNKLITKFSKKQENYPKYKIEIIDEKFYHAKVKKNYSDDWKYLREFNRIIEEFYDTKSFLYKPCKTMEEAIDIIDRYKKQIQISPKNSIEIDID